MPGRLMVGQRTLNPSIWVRFPAWQPHKIKKYLKYTGVFLSRGKSITLTLIEQVRFTTEEANQFKI